MIIALDNVFLSQKIMDKRYSHHDDDQGEVAVFYHNSKYMTQNDERTCARVWMCTVGER